MESGWALLVPGFPDTRSPLSRNGSSTDRARQEAQACAKGAEGAAAIVVRDRAAAPSGSCVATNGSELHEFLSIGLALAEKGEVRAALVQLVGHPAAGINGVLVGLAGRQSGIVTSCFVASGPESRAEFTWVDALQLILSVGWPKIVAYHWQPQLAAAVANWGSLKREKPLSSMWSVPVEDIHLLCWATNPDVWGSMGPDCSLREAAASFPSKASAAEEHLGTAGDASGPSAPAWNAALEHLRLMEQVWTAARSRCRVRALLPSVGCLRLSIVPFLAESAQRGVPADSQLLQTSLEAARRAAERCEQEALRIARRLEAIAPRKPELPDAAAGHRRWGAPPKRTLQPPSADEQSEWAAELLTPSGLARFLFDRLQLPTPAGALRTESTSAAAAARQAMTGRRRRTGGQKGGRGGGSKAPGAGGWVSTSKGVLQEAARAMARACRLPEGATAGWATTTGTGSGGSGSGGGGGKAGDGRSGREGESAGADMAVHRRGLLSPFVPRMLRLVVRGRALRKLGESSLAAMADALKERPVAGRLAGGRGGDAPGAAKEKEGAASGAGASAVGLESKEKSHSLAGGFLMARPCQVSSATGRVVVTEPQMQALPVAKGTPAELRAAPELEPGVLASPRESTEDAASGDTKEAREDLDGDLSHLWAACRMAIRPAPGTHAPALSQGPDPSAPQTPSTPHRLVVCIDYSQVEMRMLAHLCSDPGLRSAFRGESGDDVYEEIARMAFHLEPGSPVPPETRRQAKAASLGVVYGLGSQALAGQLGGDVDAAQDVRERLLVAFPGVLGWQQRLRQFARDHGFVPTAGGRRRVLAAAQGGASRQARAYGQRQAVNSIVQGSAADLLCAAIALVHGVLLPGARDRAAEAQDEKYEGDSKTRKADGGGKRKFTSGLGHCSGDPRLQQQTEAVCRQVGARLEGLSEGCLGVLAGAELLLSVHDELLLGMDASHCSDIPEGNAPAATQQAAAVVASVMAEDAPLLVAAAGAAHVRGLKHQAQLAAWLKLRQDRSRRSASVGLSAAGAAGGGAAEGAGPLEDEQRRLELVRLTGASAPSGDSADGWPKGDWPWADARRWAVAAEAADVLAVTGPSSETATSTGSDGAAGATGLAEEQPRLGVPFTCKISGGPSYGEQTEWELEEVASVS